MSLLINDAFVRTWHPRYDETEGDEAEYQLLVDRVARDMRSHGTIHQDTFLAIWRWKKAMRAIRYARMEQYDQVYEPAFRRAAQESPSRRLAVLLEPGAKLPGLSVPTASTIVHFMYPRSMPIIDVRTVGVLFTAGLVSSRSMTLKHYEEFRYVMDCIRHRFAGWNLREIDRALFAYHKQELATGATVSGHRGEGDCVAVSLLG
ncbi:MAG: hypothetical protein U1E42_05595 [Rhodospirillales bacterium]